MEEKVTFDSDGLALAGTVRGPAGMKAGDKRPAIVIMHGFGGHQDGPQQRWSSRQYAEWGYMTLCFDFRGCGDSEGERGHVTPAIEIADARTAMAYLAGRDDVDADRIALSGTSYGAIVAISAAAEDPRAKAVIAQGGWGNSRNLFRSLHPTEEAWAKFTDMVERGRKHKEETGEHSRAHRFDIVPIPEDLRPFIDERSIFDFTVETAQATLDFDPETVVAKVAPRPLLLITSALDQVVPPEGSMELFRAAGQPTDLNLFSGVDHFMFGEDDPRVVNLVGDWLAKYFPAD